MPATDPQSPPAAPDRIPKLAVTALVLAFLPCCPVTALFGALLGLIALRRMPDRATNPRGRTVAITAIIGGALLSCLWLFLLERMAINQNESYEATMIERVDELLAAEGDSATVAEAWSRQIDSKPTAADVAAFRAEATARYGPLDRFSQVSDNRSGSLFAPVIEIAGVFHFENDSPLGVVTLDVDISVPTLTLSPTFRLRSVVIQDADRGDLHLPVAPAEAPATAPVAADGGSP